MQESEKVRGYILGVEIIISVYALRAGFLEYRMGYGLAAE
jgi:hypothetical protein